MGNILRAGYTGVLLSPTLAPVTSFNANIGQEVLFYDHIYGLKDGGSGLFGGKGPNGSDSGKRRFWRPGPYAPTATINMPVTEASGSAFLDQAQSGDDFDTSFAFSCEGPSVTIYSCKVNTFSITATAGDIVTINASVMGINAASSGSPAQAPETRVVTWDEIGFYGPSGDIYSFTLNINNNCSYVYTLGANNARNMRPAVIRCGMQHVTGSFSVYGDGEDNFDIKADQTLEFDIMGNAFSLKCHYLPIRRQSTTNQAFHTEQPFVGVGDYWAS